MKIGGWGRDPGEDRTPRNTVESSRGVSCHLLFCTNTPVDCLANVDMVYCSWHASGPIRSRSHPQPGRFFAGARVLLVGRKSWRMNDARSPSVPIEGKQGILVHTCSVQCTMYLYNSHIPSCTSTPVLYWSTVVQGWYCYYYRFYPIYVWMVHSSDISQTQNPNPNPTWLQS